MNVEPWQYEDRLRAVRMLTARGETANEIAVRLHISQRTVSRYRARSRALTTSAVRPVGEAGRTAGHHERSAAA